VFLGIQVGDNKDFTAIRTHIRAKMGVKGWKGKGHVGFPVKWTPQK